MSFPLSTAFIVSHRFGYVVSSFSLSSKKSLISLFLPWPRYHWVEYCSFSMCMWAFRCFCCYWRPLLLHSDLIGGMGLFRSFYICWGLSCDQYMINFGEATMRCWEKGIFFCFRIKCYIHIHMHIHTHAHAHAHAHAHTHTHTYT